MVTSEYYVYLNIDNFMVAWEVAIGRMVSSSENPFIGGISLWFNSMLSNFSKNIGDIRLSRELKLEYVRLNKYKNQVSRLNGIFLFKTRTEAIKSCKKWFGDKFDSAKIVKILFNEKRITKVDSNWITYYINKKTDDLWMDRYWKGEKCPNYTPEWEYIVEGDGIIDDEKIRIEAYNNIINKQPYTTFTLSCTICAFSFDSIKFRDLSRVVPFFRYIKDENKIVCDYIIEGKMLKEYQKEIASYIEICKKNKELPPIFFDKNDMSCIPDLREYSYEIKIDDTVKKYFENSGFKFII